MKIIDIIVTEELGTVDVIEHDGEIVMTDLMLSKLLEYRKGARQVRSQIERNDMPITDIKANKEFINNHESFGYTKRAFAQAKTIYIFNYDDLKRFLTITSVKKDLSNFISDYYKVDDIKFIGLIRKEHDFFIMLQKTLNTIITRQYNVEKYMVDFYLEEYNLCVEYDENCHEHTKKYDDKRQSYIADKLQCKFIRVKEGMELEGIGEIFNYILSTKSVDK